MNLKWDRLVHLIGMKNVEQLQKKHVLVVGLGGVGGYVVEGLIRSGVSLTVVDSDVIDCTNLNRQLIALESTVGKTKASVMRERCLDINPDALVRSKVIFVDRHHIDQVFDRHYDYVVDACDTLSTKQLLIEKCFEENIPIISCMGTARKEDITKLEIVDIKKTSYDPLARSIRHYMKTTFPSKKLMVLSSTEVPKKCEDHVLASSIFVPASAGLMIAHFVIQEFIKKEVD